MSRQLSRQHAGRHPADERPTDADGASPLLQRLNARGFRLLMVADFLAVACVLTTINVVRFGVDWPTYTTATYTAVTLAAAGLHLITFYFGGLYERELRLGLRPQLPRIAGLVLMAVLLISLAELLTQRFVIPRGNLLALFLLSSLAVAANRRLARWLRIRREGPPRVLLVGAPDDVNLARSHLGDTDHAAIVVGETSSVRGLARRVARCDATEVLLLSREMLDDIYPEPLTSLERRGIGLLQRITARDTLLGLAGVREIAGMPFVALRSHTLPRSRAKFKRCVELAMIAVTAPVWVVAVVLVAAYVAVAAGRPILFWQDRVGRDGVPFRMVKFRTMRPDAEEGLGPVLAQRGDPRVIGTCQWLRATRLDELPQLYNVVRGEMSIVGPRPERPELTAQYEELIPGYARRHEIPPGITGLAQIHGRYHTDPEYKLGHDLQYLVNWSPVLDLQILLRTVWVVLARRV